jgi:lysophospholipase L1-like esterase
MVPVRRRLLPALLAVGLAACGSGEAASPEPDSTVGGVGALPSELPPRPTAPVTVPATSEPTETTDDPPSETTSSTPGPEEERVLPVGRLVDGNRVLVIGDSILASISDRHGGQLCDRLVPRGWEVEVNAQTGQHIEYGRQVLRRRLDAGWDAAVVMLGSNYGEDPVFYGAELNRLIEDLAPRPVVLVNVTEFKQDRAEVNYLINLAADAHDNVRVVDWASRTRDSDEFVGDDGLHLSELGREELARMIATALGRAPAGSDGACLRTR